MYELFDHTADVGLRMRAGSLDELFADAGRALFSVIVANFDAVEPVQELALRVEGSRRDDLLFDWLAELLYTFETRRVLLSDFHVSVSNNGLEATARGEPFDPDRHELDMEVKAITYHGLKVEQDGDGWLAEVIVDL
ncbi:MAG TPA: archease [Thermoguttaceae bacterium]|nr:archease [Thermoguttaceae bacterium]